MVFCLAVTKLRQSSRNHYQNLFQIRVWENPRLWGIQGLKKGDQLFTRSENSDPKDLGGWAGVIFFKGSLVLRGVVNVRVFFL